MERAQGKDEIHEKKLDKIREDEKRQKEPVCMHDFIFKVPLALSLLSFLKTF